MMVKLQKNEITFLYLRSLMDKAKEHMLVTVIAARVPATVTIIVTP